MYVIYICVCELSRIALLMRFIVKFAAVEFALNRLCISIFNRSISTIPQHQHTSYRNKHSKCRPRHVVVRLFWNTLNIYIHIYPHAHTTIDAGMNSKTTTTTRRKKTKGHAAIQNTHTLRIYMVFETPQNSNAENINHDKIGRRIVHCQ